MSSPTRVLHIFGRMNRGGAEMRTLDMMRLLNPERIRFDFCTLSGLPGDLDDEIRSLGGDVYPCRLGVRFPGRFRRILRDLQPQVVHSHVLHSSGYMLKLAVAENVPTRIAHFRSTGDGREPNLRRRAQGMILRRWIDRYATDILAVSHGAMREAWTRYYPADERCNVVYTGIDPAPFEMEIDSASVKREFAFPESSRVCIHVGNFNVDKNHRRLIQIFAGLLGIDDESYLLLVGRGGTPPETESKRIVENLGLSERVAFAGSRSDVPRLLKSADVMINPSLREGLPGVVLESCAAGTPVLATNLPGVEEIASVLGSVTTMPLSASDKEWADAASRLGAMPKDRYLSLERFRQSPFSIETAIQRHLAVWEGERAPTND